MSGYIAAVVFKSVVVVGNNVGLAFGALEQFIVIAIWIGACQFVVVQNNASCKRQIMHKHGL